MSTDFRTLGVPAPLVSVLASQGKDEAFPIQADTLPDALAGRDLLGRGKTGSGKTLAFALPLVARIGTKAGGGQRRPGRPLGLILAPTRELATQINAVIEPLAAAYGLRSATVFGGVPQSRQVTALRNGVDILVACPGRLEDLMQQHYVNLDAIEITVLDEADHMADLGFLPGVTRILAATPAGGQRMLFSATLDNGVDKLVKRFLVNPVMHSVDDANSPVAAMTHHVFAASTPAAKTELVRTLASGTGRRILFLRTKHHAKKLAMQLTASGIPAVDLHGNLSQAARDRNLAAFGAGEVRVLVATDVAARGVHVDDVELVVHVDPPTEHKAYLHRSGRTARAGSAGDVVTIVLPDQESDAAAMLRKAEIQVPVQRVTAASEAVTALVGEVAPYVTPTARPAVRPQARTSGRASAPGGRSIRQPRAAGQSGRTAGQSRATGQSRTAAQPARIGTQTGGAQLVRSQGANAQRKRAVQSGAAQPAPAGSGRARRGRRASAPQGSTR